VSIHKPTRMTNNRRWSLLSVSTSIPSIPKLVSIAVIALSCVTAAVLGTVTTATVARASDRGQALTKPDVSSPESLENPAASASALFRVSGRAVIFHPCVPQARATEARFKVPPGAGPWECTQPFTDGTIFLTSSEKPFSYSMSPGPDGSFAFLALPRGNYVARAVPPVQAGDSIIFSPQPTCESLAVSVPAVEPIVIACSPPKVLHTVSGNINVGPCDPNVCDSPNPESNGFVLTFESAQFQTQGRSETNSYEVRVPSGVYEITVTRLDGSHCANTVAEVYRGTRFDITCDRLVKTDAQ
jgi:hypothetical protein